MEQTVADNIAKQAVDWSPQGKRKAGRILVDQEASSDVMYPTEGNSPELEQSKTLL